MVKLEFVIDFKADTQIMVNLLAREDATPDESKLARNIETFFLAAWEAAAQQEGLGDQFEVIRVEPTKGSDENKD